MTMFITNILLALAWIAVTGQFHPDNFMAGFAFSYLILWLVHRTIHPSNYFSKVPQVVAFVFFFGKELIKANLRVAYDVVTPHHHMHPGVVGIPLDVKTDAEITLLANLITLTPGTLSLDISADRRILYVHAMYLDNLDEFRRVTKQGFERRIRELLR